MQDKSREIFGNKMEESVVSKARHSKKKFEEKFGDDSHADYQVSYKKNAYIGDLLNVSNVLIDGDDLDITESLWQLPLLQMQWGTSHTGWI